MSAESPVEVDRQKILAAKEKGGLATLGAYTKLSGPGWMQSALTLGGGSLGSSLYLGILAGVSMIWVQPFAMILGVIMLSAISYVSLSTNERPFQAINRHINPVLGWSWLIASLMANMVWSMPQYSLCHAVLEQNFLPGVVTDANKWPVAFILLAFCTAITWSYGSGNIGMKIYEATLKIVVAVIVLCFFGVVIRMGMTGDGIDWGAVCSGLIPQLHHIYKPAATFDPLLNAIADPAARAYWSDFIVSQQRDVMISAGAAAVGINMTFLLPYNLLSRGWNKDFRGLTIFDLSTGMFIPFVVATGCIVIAAATQFHAQLPANVEATNRGLAIVAELQPAEAKLIAIADEAIRSGELSFGEGATPSDSEKLAALAKPAAGGSDLVPGDLREPLREVIAARKTIGAAGGLISSRNAVGETGEYELPAEPEVGEQQIAAALVKRDTGSLAASLQRLFATDTSDGRFFSNVVFGAGVIGMTLSSISLMMLISGFIICEIFGKEPKGWLFRIGCLASANGVLWPLVWDGSSKAWLTVVAGVFGAMLLPIAYVTFFLMMNQKSLMGEERPKGLSRVVWNVLMALAAIAATAAGISSVMKRAGYTGLGFAAAYIALVLVVQFTRKPPASESPAEPASA